MAVGKGGRKGGYRRSEAKKVAAKVAAVEIVGKANPRKKEKGRYLEGDILEVSCWT